MKILTEKKPGPDSLYQLAGVARLEDSEDGLYCGHYTMEGLKQFLDEMKKHHKANDTVSLRAIYRPDLKSYTLAAVPDAKDPLLTDHSVVILQGCDYGSDGNNEQRCRK